MDKVPAPLPRSLSFVETRLRVNQADRSSFGQLGREESAWIMLRNVYQSWVHCSFLKLSFACENFVRDSSLLSGKIVTTTTHSGAFLIPSIKHKAAPTQVFLSTLSYFLSFHVSHFIQVNLRRNNDKKSFRFVHMSELPRGLVSSS